MGRQWGIFLQELQIYSMNIRDESEQSGGFSYTVASS